MKKVFLGILVILLSFYAYKSYKKRKIFTPKETAEAFIEIYEKNLWGVGSGPGSDPKNAEPYLNLLSQYLNASDIHSIFDLGCGDWRLMSTLTVPADKIYTGFDLVPNVIENNIKLYQKNNIMFHVINGTEDLKDKHADLLVVKDVIQHWPNEQITYFLNNILPNFKYALITNDFNQNNNSNINPGQFRCIDLEAAPFNVSKTQFKKILDYEAHGIIKRVYLYTNPNYKG